MENRRFVILALLLTALILLLLSPVALAYENKGAHREINSQATNLFKTVVMQNDPILKYADLNWNEGVYGYSWDPSDGVDDSKTTLAYSQSVSWYRQKCLRAWIYGGGFSGDEPELPMGVRHYYDPSRTPHYLTDQMGWSQVFGLALSRFQNPEMSNVDWGLTENENQYSYVHGKDYFQVALASEDPDEDGFYGNAWRAVGEQMHLMADLTVPAHVRNDGHAICEPYEVSTSASTIKIFGDDPSVYPPSPSINYKTTTDKNYQLMNLMDSVASWTNHNFYSTDTISVNGGPQDNMETPYGYPIIVDGPDSKGYYYTMVDGKKVPAYRKTLAAYFGWLYQYSVRGEVLSSQHELLIPTAVRACEAVLDDFLPRFTVTVLDVQPNTEPGMLGYVVSARIDHIPTNAWPDNLLIKNGAHIVVYNRSTGRNIDYPLKISFNKPDSNLNTISYPFPAQPGEEVSVFYDFGGYVVRSAKNFTVPQPAATPTLKATPTPAPTSSPVPGQHELFTMTTVHPTEGWKNAEWTYYTDDDKPYDGRYGWSIGYNGYGYPHGTYKTFFKDGTLREEGHFKDGKMDGNWTSYWSDGTLRGIEEYIDDALIRVIYDNPDHGWGVYF